jgi:hypothetical protein
VRLFPRTADLFQPEKYTLKTQGASVTATLLSYVGFMYVIPMTALVVWEKRKK